MASLLRGREHGHRRAWSYCIILTLLLAVVLTACVDAPEVKGTSLSLPRPATPFELENQLGQSVSLTDHKGKVVLLTFLYTRCPDVCPLVASQLRDTYQILGSEGTDVAFMAVSVDPERDTVEAAYEFSERWDMTANWDFLVGDRNELARVWDAYYIDPSTSSHSQETAGETPGQHGVQNGPLNGLIENNTENYVVAHSTPVFLIDGDGIVRIVFTPPFEPEDIAHDIRVLFR